MKPGSDMPCGSASSLTLNPTSPPPGRASCASTLRRVESDSAANTRSISRVERDASLLTIWFSIGANPAVVKREQRYRGATPRSTTACTFATVCSKNAGSASVLPVSACTCTAKSA